MTTELPVPVTLDLVDGWEVGDPDLVGAPGAAFVARFPLDDQGFSPVITMDGEILLAEETLETLADRSIEMLSREGPVRLRSRREVGDEQAPGLVQALGVVHRLDGNDLDLIQDQVYVQYTDTTDPARRAVVRLVLTSTHGLHERVLPDFQHVVDSLAPEGN